MSPKNHALIAILFGMGAACSSVRTHYDYDPNADFSRWRAYAWYPTGSPPTGDPRLDNPLLHNRIVSAIERTLGEAGYSRILNGEPDFYVNYHLSTEDRLEVRTMNRVYMGGPHMRHWGGAGWGGVAWTDTHVDQYEKGTLVIDFVDPLRRQLVWRGSGTRRLARNPRGHQVTHRVNEAVAEVLDQFPPR
jgi:hypothetical protein